jgi:hypothetical protein
MLNRQDFGFKKKVGGVVFDKYLPTATVCTLSLKELLPYVLLLTAAYEVAGWKDCERVQLRSDIIGPIGAKRTPLLDVIMGTRSRLMAEKLRIKGRPRYRTRNKSMHVHTCPCLLVVISSNAIAIANSRISILVTTPQPFKYVKSVLVPSNASMRGVAKRLIATKRRSTISQDR